jgi:hypothetical protein
MGAITGIAMAAITTDITTADITIDIGIGWDPSMVDPGTIAIGRQCYCPVGAGRALD